jgi:hypothetical protein
VASREAQPAGPGAVARAEAQLAERPQVPEGAVLLDAPAWSALSASTRQQAWSAPQGVRQAAAARRLVVVEQPAPLVAAVKAGRPGAVGPQPPAPRDAAASLVSMAARRWAAVQEDEAAAAGPSVRPDAAGLLELPPWEVVRLDAVAPPR